uniref:Uncharacterized protein n=1 Tax=Trichogramma kaykai TaxID=54128 RepID=A0ABD2X7U1_9HYME
MPERVLSHQKSREPFIEGHDYIAIDYAFGTAAARETVAASRDFRRCDAALLRADVGRALDDATITGTRDVTSMLRNFYSATTTALDRHAPMSVRAARGLERIGCASLEGRRKFFLSLQMYRAVSLRRPQYFSEMFQRRDTGIAPRTRSSSLPQLTVPDSSSEVRRRSFSIMGAKLWNELPLAAMVNQKRLTVVTVPPSHCL